MEKDVYKRQVQTNVFTTGDLDIGLKEPDWDPNENDGKNMYPGYTVYKLSLIHI